MKKTELVGICLVPLALMALGVTIALGVACAAEPKVIPETKIENPAVLPAAIPDKMPQAPEKKEAQATGQPCPCVNGGECTCPPGQCHCHDVARTLQEGMEIEAQVINVAEAVSVTRPAPANLAASVSAAAAREYSSEPCQTPYDQALCQSVAEGKPLVIWIDTPRNPAVEPEGAVVLEVKECQGEPKGYVVMRSKGVKVDFDTERHPSAAAPMGAPIGAPAAGPYPVFMQHLQRLQSCPGGNCGRCGR
jgi:hypothetical protein